MWFGSGRNCTYDVLYIHFDFSSPTPSLGESSQSQEALVTEGSRLHPSNGLFSDFVDNPDDLVINLNVYLANLY